MGAFDTYNCKPEHAVACPGCKTPLQSFQSKKLGCLMETYREGEPATFWRPVVEAGSFEIYAVCSQCRGYVELRVPISEEIIGAPEVLSFRQAQRGREEAAPTPVPEPPEAAHLSGIRSELESAMRTIREREIADVERFLAEIRLMVDRWLEQARKKA